MKFLSLFVVSGIIFIFIGCKKKDIHPPEIILYGSADISQELNTLWSEPGFSAQDDNDGDITENVVISGTVNKDFAGTYNIQYTVTDLSGNETSVYRKVIIYNEAKFLLGSYSALDTCQTSNAKIFTAVITPSNTVNNEFIIENFGAWDSICNCNTVMKMKISADSPGAIVSWNQQLIANNDSIVGTLNGGILLSNPPAQLSLTYQWTNGTTIQNCTGIYTHL